MRFRAVIFDLGGVVVGSPLEAIAAYEREQGLPTGVVNRVVVSTGAGGAWSRLERGELTLEEFYPAFEQDCAGAGCELSARALMARVAEATLPRQAMLEAIACIRQQGLLAAALTNNWVTDDPGTGALKPHFDAVVESAVVGLRKPDPRIFTLACETLGVALGEAIFLDDIGANLKAARALGMTTIKVTSPETALEELEALLGFGLRAQARIQALLREHVAIVPYDPRWPELFRAEEAHLRACLPADLVRRIEHFGSTAVPGLAAKAVIDVLVEVTDLEATKARIVPVLEAQGYDYFWRPTRGDDEPPFYAWFIKRDASRVRTHHLHMVEGHFPQWDGLLFRDHLIEHPDVAREYERLKRRLAAAHSHDRGAYTDGKTDFVTSVTAQAKRHLGRA